MKKIEIIFENVPTNVPIKVTLNVTMENFSEVKLYRTLKDGKPVIIPGKPWYIYYYFRHPETKKMVKIMDTCKINRYKTIKERTAWGNAHVKSFIILLENGFNPFTKEGIEETPLIDDNFAKVQYSVESALQYAYDNKLGTWKDATADDYRTRKNVFIDWCKENKIDSLDIKDLAEIHIISFMNWLINPNGRAVGKTSQDNYKRCLSSLFAKLVKDKIVTKNLFTEIETSKGKPLKNTPFTGYEVIDIKNYLLRNDMLQLYHFVQFVIYSFLRPREIVRLTAGDFNLREKYLKIETKTERKAIVKLVGPVVTFLEEINIDKLPSKANIFTNTGKFEVWDASEKSKVDHFGHQFTKVKEHFKFDRNYGIYSFRHTAVLDLYYSFLRQGLTERDAVLKLMPITRHASENALRNYLRDVGGMLPKDYGADYTLDF